ncbi:MAG: hypothetical protein GXP02_07375 [Alphaproteobacteria bacterium]|nr:hypothetical protein [Alphaproteobacteria bacterium]
MLKHLHPGHYLQHLFLALAAGIMTLAVLAYSSSPARAVPSFAVQTGMACSACHVGDFGPQLKPFGRRFKLLGYALGSNPKGFLPISGMVLAGFASTKADVPGGTAPGFGSNDNVTLDQVSMFLAGRLAGWLPGLGYFPR